MPTDVAVIAAGVRGERAISDYTDQAGNPISRDRMIAMVCESMLANVIAFEKSGMHLQELMQSVGRDEGMITGQGVVLQTPRVRHLSDENAKSLIESYS